MKKNNLLASVALFSELYNSDSYTNIPDILAEFIKGAIVLENKYNFNSTELKDLMDKVYGFSIPESVLRTVIQNRLKGAVSVENKIFYVDSAKINPSLNNIKESVELIGDEQNRIVENLYIYIEKRVHKTLSETEKKKVFSTFSHILMENGYSDKYSDLVSAYIISNEKNEYFKDCLNSIKEGLILYQGINFTGDINQLGSWTTNLTLYLSTEHLFNCLGYNGLLLQEIFDDFLKLVTEINLSSKNRGKTRKTIELKYLEETKAEIDNFFVSAESILKGYKRLDQSKEAMKFILKGSDSIADIKRKQVKLYSDLKKLGVEFQPVSFDIENAAFNVVDKTLVDQLKKQSDERGRAFDEDYCINVLRIFTKINTFRHGNNRFPIENIGHLYITENGFAKHLAHHENVKFANYDVPFAKDIDFIISKFWFKLKKGFNNKNDLPKSFDVVTKAKIIISSHISSSLSKHYEKLTNDFDNGKLSEDEALELASALRDKNDAPEDITSESIEKALDLLNDDDILENFLREKTRRETLYTQTLKEKEDLERQLRDLKEKEDYKIKLEKEKEEKKRKENFVENRWRQYEKQNNSDTLYFFLISLITVLPIVVGLLLKAITKLDELMQSLGDYQYLVWALLAVILLVEVFGRAYLFNKDRIKNGWNWLLIKSDKDKYLQIENEQKILISSTFESESYN